MRSLSAFALTVAIATGIPTSVSAQRLPFERTVELSEPAVLDVSTVGGSGPLVAASSRNGSIRVTVG